MEHLLGALVAFPEDLDLIPSNNMVANLVI